MTRARFIDVHALQTFSYVNLNRDENNRPKTVIYGGAERTRVSSQAWKRAIRVQLQDQLGQPAVRTRLITRELFELLVADGWATELAQLAVNQLLSAAGDLKSEKAKDADVPQTKVLLFVPADTPARLAALCREHRSALEVQAGSKKPTQVLPDKDVAEILKATNSMISLFGRMLAEIPGGQVDGAVQVAHAFTTHASEPELDFFTAVDDALQVQGSGHMSTAEFSSGTFYRYAAIDLDELTKNLSADRAGALEVTRAFLATFLDALPESKKNSTAPRTIPDLVHIAVRGDRPISLAPAFEQPVRPAGEGGWALPSRQKLAEYSGRIDTLWGSTGRLFAGHAGVDDKDLAGLGDRHSSYTTLIDAAVHAATQAAS
ncbi:CRISPR system Cascade subunit CasC [Catenulispora sp. EB89]|uniref:type I-E CRISPR-associated protein Cas7/Cse4/CasC n=1 Tax=Catenulispora sp. EB89 TaxID=3156257 RepID=UPI003511DB24